MVDGSECDILRVRTARGMIWSAGGLAVTGGIWEDKKIIESHTKAPTVNPAAIEGTEPVRT